MRLFPRLFAVALMLAGMYFLVEHVKGLQSAPDVDNAKISTYFLSIVLLGAVVAITSGVLLLPIIGELAGNFIFTPNVEIEKSPHSAALAKLAAGDYEGAIEEYKKVFDDDPQDMHAVNEVVRLYCEKLQMPESASDFLVEILSLSDWTPEERAYFSERLVDVCWNYRRDAARSIAILTRITENMPETREAANAAHRISEIERTSSEEAYLAAQAAKEAEAQENAEAPEDAAAAQAQDAPPEDGSAQS